MAPFRDGSLEATGHRNLACARGIGDPVDRPPDLADLQ
jgi:hypothetical protein